LAGERARATNDLGENPTADGSCTARRESASLALRIARNLPDPVVGVGCIMLIIALWLGRIAEDMEYDERHGAAVLEARQEAERRKNKWHCL
jgi:hypothetical protein